ncbi:MAG: hypothetical protein Q7S00_04940, partial [bacterium]|nr:hypothetical protein [bacterium]
MEETKQVIDEKRVKSTVIRRRARTATVTEIQEEEKKTLEAKAEPEAIEVAPEEKPAVVEPAVGEEKKPVKLKTASQDEEEKVVEKAKIKKIVKKKSRDELELELIERAGGLRKFAEISTTTPERLDRVFQPKRGSKKKKNLTLANKNFKKTELTTPKAAKRVIRVEGSITVGELAKRMSLKVVELVR